MDPLYYLKTCIENRFKIYKRPEFSLTIDDAWKQLRIVVWVNSSEIFTITTGFDCYRFRGLAKRDRDRDFPFTMIEIDDQIAQHIIFCYDMQHRKEQIIDI